MKKRIQFFSLKEDLLPVLAAVERGGPLKYVRMDNSLSPDFETFLHGADIPNLGKADAPTASVCETFLVTEATVPVTIERFEGDNGIQRYCLDQLLNRDTVTFTPAGVWNEDVVLYGRVATVSDSAIAQSLMKRFSSAFRSEFRKVKEFWVGGNARALLAAGKRLTIAEQSPREFDLTATP